MTKDVQQLQPPSPCRTMSLVSTPEDKWTCRSILRNQGGCLWTVDDVARLIEFKKKEFLFINLLFFTLGSIWSRGITKTGSITKLYFFSIHLLYEYSKRFVQQPVLQPAAKCTRTLKANIFIITEQKVAASLFPCAVIYTVSQKKQDTKLLPITSPNVNRFSKFFHWQTHW